MALDQGDYAEARGRLEESVALQRQVGDRSATALTLNSLGNVTRAMGDYATTRALYEESLRINRELGDQWGLAYQLEGMAGLAAVQGQAERALRLAGAAATLRTAIGARLPPAEQTRLEQSLEPARRALDLDTQAAAVAEGSRLSLEQACEYALHDRLSGGPS